MSEPGRRYRIGANARRGDGGRLLIGGWPPRWVRLSEAGAEAVDAALAGREAPGGAKLIAKLGSYGMLDPVVGTATAETPVGGSDPARDNPAATVTFVVPVRDAGTALADLVARLVRQGPVIVVDDRSGDGSPDLAREAGATVVANDGPPGPGGARNVGWRLAATEFIAFVDADCRTDGAWARPLATLLEAETRLALAAPRIRGTDGPDRLSRWERTCSPLDMGAAGGLVGPGRPVPYVPSAALVARRAALAELDGFDPGLRFGEDVDLAWRAVAAGMQVRYAPEVEVRHPPRPTLRARARQHFDYGSSAAALTGRHPASVAPLRPSRMVAAVALLAAGSPGAALLAAGAVTAVAARRQPAGPVRRTVARLAVEGQLRAGRELGRAVSREWLPLAALAVAHGGRPRRFALTALAIDLAASTAPEPLQAPINSALRLLDNAAYTAGVWRGAITHRSPGPLLPRTSARLSAG